jgi:phosphatidylglycerol:prolipoprotein diacylglycerol transferase
MSFHGGLLGVLVALAYYAKKIQKPFLALTDFISPVIPIGLGAGRIGNFINGELWGRVTNMPWGMSFPHGGPWLRHPSQLYEFAMEGLLLFLILWFYSSKPKPLGAVSGLFALAYGVFRCIAEFFREPDAHIGYLIGGITEGQLLSLPLIMMGLLLLYCANKKRKIAT